MVFLLENQPYATRTDLRVGSTGIFQGPITQCHMYYVYSTTLQYAASVTDARSLAYKDQFLDKFPGSTEDSRIHR